MRGVFDCESDESDEEGGVKGGVLLSRADARRRAVYVLVVCVWFSGDCELYDDEWGGGV